MFQEEKMARLNQEYSSKRELILKQHASLHEYHLNAVKDKYKEDSRLIDLKLDDPNEIGISVFNVIFGDIIEPPIKDIIHTDDYNKTQVIDSKI